MKKILFSAIIIMMLPALSGAQTIQTERLFQKYRGQEGVVSVWVPGFVMKFAASIADLDPEEEALLRSIRSVRVLTIEDNFLYPGVNFTREVNFREGTNGFHSLIQVTDSGQDVHILAKHKRGKIKDLLILVGGTDNVYVHLKGRLSADMLGSISQIAGLDQLDHITQL